MIEKIKEICLKNKMFNLFSSIILFGSIVKKNKNPSDIDLLLVYKEYSHEILKKIEEIKLLFFETFNLYADIIVLSEKELKETEFLKKIQTNYIKIK